MVWLVVTTKNAEYAKGVLRMTRYMGTDTLVEHKKKAAGSCRTPGASRPPTSTASAAAREKPLGSARIPFDGVAGRISEPGVT